MTPDCTHPCIFPWESVFPGPLVLLCVHPKILLTCLSEDKSISFTGCVAQFFFPTGLAYRGCFLLPAMAYDCYVATSKPLLYAQVMPSKLCAFFIAASYLHGFTNTFIVTKGTFALNFCSYNVIDDFFRDISPLEKLACGRRYLPGCAVLWPRLQHHHPHCAHPGFLPLHQRHRPEDPLHPGLPQSFLHLLLAAHLRHPVLWLRSLCLLSSTIKLFTGQG